MCEPLVLLDNRNLLYASDLAFPRNALVARF